MKASNFTLPSTNQNDYSLKNSIGKYVVLYFYPKDDTPGCTIETNDFNKLLSKFKKLDCEIYGISKDSLKDHDKFRAKYKIKFIELLFEVCEQEKTTLLMVSHDTSLIEHFDNNYLLESLNKIL